jgi:hypothetical protein
MPQSTQLPQSLAELRPSAKKKSGGGQGVESAGYGLLKQQQEENKMEGLTVREGIPFHIQLLSFR